MGNQRETLISSRLKYITLLSHQTNNSQFKSIIGFNVLVYNSATNYLWVGIDLPPVILPLVKLELMERWPVEQVVCSQGHCGVLPGCIPCATVQWVSSLDSRQKPTRVKNKVRNFDYLSNYFLPDALGDSRTIKKESLFPGWAISSTFLSVFGPSASSLFQSFFWTSQNLTRQIYLSWIIRIRMCTEGHFLVRRRRSRSLIRGIPNEAALPLFELGGSRPKAVEGGCFPLQGRWG